ncbi:uncharacterized protein METZ01_LOCUS518, partial [marine metagenome]
VDAFDINMVSHTPTTTLAPAIAAIVVPSSSLASVGDMNGINRSAGRAPAAMPASKHAWATSGSVLVSDRISRLSPAFVPAMRRTAMSPKSFQRELITGRPRVLSLVA